MHPKRVGDRLHGVIDGSIIPDIAGVKVGRGLTCIFHEGGCVCHVFAKRINLIERLSGIVAQGQFVPIHFQEKSAVTD
jgi:hypothetical protein